MHSPGRALVYRFAFFLVLLSATIANAQTALRFIPMSPCRVVDTRWPDGPFGGPAIGAGTERDFVLPSGACNIPGTAAAYSLNVTVVPHERLGVLTVWPTGQSMPQISTLNSVDARVKADAAIVPAGSGGAVSVYASGTTDVILDINGYFVPAIGQGLAFFPLTPCRVADTREPVGLLGGPYLQAGIQRDFPILNATTCNIPATAQAYSLNFTVVPRPRLGFLAVWPAGQPRPQSSTLNAPTGAVTANAAIVPAGTSGDIDVYPNNDTDLVIDIDGYFADPSSGPNPLTLYDLSPCRALDTRQTSGAFSGELSVDIVDSFCYVPSNAAAYVLNATVVPNPRLGFLTLWPDGEQQPGVSTLNATDGAITSNMAVVPTQNGWIDAYASASTQLILDISSYFGPITPAITSTSLPSGVLDVFYSAQVYAAGGFPPYTWEVVQGSLPPGLSLGRATGLISGVPTVQGTSSFTLKITDTQNQTATARLSITIQQAPPLIITTTYLPDGTQGVPYDQTLTASGGVPPYMWTINAGSLPAGLTLHASGEITGTPTTTGTSNFAVKVTDSESPQQAATANLSITIDPNPVPVLQYMSPASSPQNSGPVTLQIEGSGFTQASIVQWNGTPLVTTYQDGYNLTATIPASDLQSLGNNYVTVYNAPPGGGTSAAQPFTVFVSIQTNDLVFDPVTQLIWASIPSLAGPALGNSVVSIDPATGVIGTPIWVGSEPTKLAISSDGTTLWVGLNGAGAVRKVDLTSGTAGLQFSLGGGNGLYNAPYAAASMAVMPGQPNTLAVVAGSSGSQGFVTIYDNGVARPNMSQNPYSAIAFSPAGNELYGVTSFSGYWVLSVGSSGITGETEKNQNANAGDLRYDSGKVYLTNGTVLDAEQGTLLGTFYAGQGQNAAGPVAVDSTIGRAWILETNFGNPNGIGTYDISTFVLDGTIGYGYTYDGTFPSSLLRWGQDGLAFRFPSEVFVLRSALVRDLSHTLADMSITASGPATGNTGTNLAYTLRVNNLGPNTATPVVVTDNVSQDTVFSSASTTQGYCSGSYVVQCNLGSMRNNATATVTINVTALSAGAVQNTAQVSAAQGDPNLANNTAAVNTVISGQTYNPVPALTSLAPGNAQAGSASFMLTVNGNQFTSTSQVLWNGAALPTSFVNSTQLTAQVSSGLLANAGWAAVAVSNPAPGGGVTASQPFTIYQALSLDTDFLLFDPFTRKLYASVPSTASQLQGNSVVAIDPLTGVIGPPVNIGSQPGHMAESDDGMWLYVILQGSNRLARYDLATGQADPVTYALDPPNEIQGIPPQPRDLAVLPGTNSSVAVDLGDFYGTGLLDISQGVGTFRPQLTGIYSGSGLSFPDAQHLYTVDVDTSGGEFYRWNVTSSGLTRIDGSTLYGLGGFGGPPLKLDNSLIYGGNGGLVNPVGTVPSQLAIYELGGALGGGTVTGVTSAPDAAINRAFFLATSNGFDSPTVLSFDQSRYEYLGWVSLSGLAPGPNLMRWGQDGLAFQMGDLNSSPGQGQVIILRGGFVLPEWGTSNPTPGLVSVNPSGAQSGGGNFYLTATGSSFVPGAVLLWNGSARTTTYQDSQHLKVAIPASDIRSPGTATLTVVNPGSAPSGGISFVIH